MQRKLLKRKLSLHKKVQKGGRKISPCRLSVLYLPERTDLLVFLMGARYLWYLKKNICKRYTYTKWLTDFKLSGDTLTVTFDTQGAKEKSVWGKLTEQMKQSEGITRTVKIRWKRLRMGAREENALLKRVNDCWKGIALHKVQKGGREKSAAPISYYTKRLVPLHYTCSGSQILHQSKGTFRRFCCDTFAKKHWYTSP